MAAKQNPSDSKALALAVGKATHAGSRENNEDAFCYAPYEAKGGNGCRGFLAMVADGIGGQVAGEEASQDAVKVTQQYFETLATSNPLHDLKQALIKAHGFIYKHSLEKSGLQGMGTTAAVAVVMDDKLHVAHVGDSRIYLIRGQDAYQLTADHTWAQDAVDAGRLTTAQARSHPNKNVINRHLGIREDVAVDLRIRPLISEREKSAASDNGDLKPREDVQPIPLLPGDVVVLCTDGLSDLVQGPEIRSVINKKDAQGAAEQLVAMARARGDPKNTDNITVLVVEVAGRKRQRPVWVFALPVLALVAVVAIISALTRGTARPQPEPTPVAIASPTRLELVATTAATSTRAATPVTASATGVRAVPTTRADTPTPVTSPAAMATLVPTATAMPTHTPSPVAQVQPTSVSQPTQPPTAGRTLPPNLLAPPPNETVLSADFRWQPAGALPTGAAYEVVWWHQGDPPSTAKALVRATTDTSLPKTDLEVLYYTHQAKRIFWTVLIVRTAPYERLTQPEDGEARLLGICHMEEKTCKETDPASGEVKEVPCAKQVCP